MTTKRNGKQGSGEHKSKRRSGGRTGASGSRKRRAQDGTAGTREPQNGEGPRRTAMAVAEAGLDKKALNVEVIDVQDKVDYADYVVVMSGRSDRQVQALARGVEEDVERRNLGHCLGVEGLPRGNWVLMDFGDVVVHIFHRDTRGYYDLESLWMDAARVDVGDVDASSTGSDG